MNWKLIRYIDFCIGIPFITLVSMFRTRRRPYPPEPPAKILLIKFWGIGNIFMLLPSIQALHTTFPEAEIDFLTLESNRDALHSLGVVNRITTIDTSSISSFIRSWKAAVGTMGAIGYDLAIDFEQFARFSALTTMQSRAAASIGYATKGQHRHHLYTCVVEYDNNIHITRSFYTLAARAGATAPFPTCISTPNSAEVKGQGIRLLESLGIQHTLPIAVMHIGTSENFKERRWAPHRYAELAELLRDCYGFQIILTGLPEESHLIRETTQHLKSVEQIYDLGGRFAFTDYFALISEADLIISADTASVHMASALQIPVVGLYGPNTPLLYGPWGGHGLAITASFDCSPCITNFNGKINICRHPDGRGACMRAITTKQVFVEIEKSFLLPHAPWHLTKLSRELS